MLLNISFFPPDSTAQFIPVGIEVRKVGDLRHPAAVAAALARRAQLHEQRRRGLGPLVDERLAVARQRGGRLLARQALQVGQRLVVGAAVLKQDVQVPLRLARGLWPPHKEMQSD